MYTHSERGRERKKERKKKRERERERERENIRVHVKISDKVMPVCFRPALMREKEKKKGKSQRAYDQDMGRVRRGNLKWTTEIF